MATHITDFRVYRRGIKPGDWVERWNMNSANLTRIEGAAHDLSNRNVYKAVGVTSPSAMSWSAPDADTGHANQEVLTRFRFPVYGSAAVLVALLRGAGTAVSDSAYRTYMNLSAGSLVIDKRVAAVTTTINTQMGRTWVRGAFYWGRFRVNSTSLSSKVWLDGETEPVSWDVTGTDSSLTDGWVGLHSNVTGDEVEHAFFSVGTNGDTAPGESSLPSPLDQWCLLGDEEIEITAEVQHRNPVDDTLYTEWFSSHGRTMSPTDYPPSSSASAMEPLIQDVGNIAQALTSDSQFANAAVPAIQQLVLSNDPTDTSDANGPLDDWEGLSFSGRPIIIRMGKRWLTKPTPTTAGVLMPHRHFEIVYQATCADEPDVGPVVRIPLSSPSKVLSQTVTVRRNAGIANCARFLTATGVDTVTRIAAYDLGRFTGFVRFRCTAAPTATVRLHAKVASGTDINWGLNLLLNSGFVQLVGTSGGVLDMNITGSTNLCDGEWHEVAFARNGSETSYLKVDNVVVGTDSTLSGSPDLSVANIQFGFRTAGTQPVDICSAVLVNQYLSPDEATALFSTRLEGTEPGVVGLWRHDDGTGAVVTDYSANANHGALTGVVNTDYSWQPTYLGSPEQAGTYMPMSGGAIFHAPTVPIDPSRELHRYNDRGPSSGATVNVRAKGAALVLTTNYTLPTSPGLGVIDVVGAADQPITFGTTAAAVPSKSMQLPQLIKEELVTRGSFTNQNADYDSFLALRSLLPMIGGYYYPQPPKVSDVLGLLSELGAHYRLDSSGRACVGFLPAHTISPDPFGHAAASTLEFLGYPNRGVTLSDNAALDLAHSSGLNFSIHFAFKLHTAIRPDTSTSSSFTYHPDGQTLIDKHGDLGAFGYYIGFDGRDGGLIFSVPGLTSGTGSHFRKIGNASWWKPGGWYVVTAHVDSSANRSLSVRYLSPVDGQIHDLGDTYPTADLSCSGVLTASAAPLRVGHGPRGSFANGSIAFIIGCSPAAGAIGSGSSEDPIADAMYGGEPEPVPVVSGTERYNLYLNDGDGDRVSETLIPLEGRVEGARWCPRLTLDFTSLAGPEMPGIRRLNPAHFVEARYRPNLHPLIGADVAAGVSVSDRASLGRPFLAHPIPDPPVLADYPLARDVILDTNVYNAPDAQWVATRMKERLNVGRYVADISDWVRSSLRLMLTDEVLISHDRYLPGGEASRVYALNSKLSELGFDISVIGYHQ